MHYHYHNPRINVFILHVVMRSAGTFLVDTKYIFVLDLLAVLLTTWY